MFRAGARASAQDPDACLALLRSSNDWLAGRSEGKTATLFESDVESAYNKVVVQERAKWQSEQASLSRNAPGQPTYMVATLVVLLRKGSAFPAIQGVAELREACRQTPRPRVALQTSSRELTRAWIQFRNNS